MAEASFLRLLVESACEGAQRGLRPWPVGAPAEAHQLALARNASGSAGDAAEARPVPDHAELFAAAAPLARRALAPAADDATTVDRNRHMPEINTGPWMVLMESVPAAPSAPVPARAAASGMFQTPAADPALEPAGEAPRSESEPAREDPVVDVHCYGHVHVSEWEECIAWGGAPMAAPPAEASTADPMQGFEDMLGKLIRRGFRSSRLLDGTVEQSIVWDTPRDHARRVPLIVDVNDDSVLLSTDLEAIAGALVPAAEAAEEAAPSGVSVSWAALRTLGKDASYETGRSIAQAGTSLLYKFFWRHGPTATSLHTQPAMRFETAPPMATEEDRRRIFRPQTSEESLVRRSPFGMRAFAPQRLRSQKSILEEEEMRAVAGLSAVGGPGCDKLVVYEYLERHPPLLSLAGMWSEHITYHRVPPGTDDDVPEGLQTFGKLVVLTSADQELPMLGEVDAGVFPDGCVDAVHNKLFRAPVQPTGVDGPAAHGYVDFLLVRPATEERSFVLRAMPTVCLVGQTQPLVEVPHPRSRVFRDLQHALIRVRLFRAIMHGNGVVDAGALERAFPESCKDAVRRAVREVAYYVGQSGTETARHFAVKEEAVARIPQEAELRRMKAGDSGEHLDCEALCRLIAAEVGMQRLVDAGLAFAGPDELERSIGGLPLSQRVVARRACAILRAAPWETTRALAAAVHGTGMLRLDGGSEPLVGFGFAFSVRGCGGGGPGQVPARTEEEAAARAAREARRQQFTSKHGALSRLKLKDCITILADYGLTEAEVKGMTHAERKDEIKRRFDIEEDVAEGGDARKSRDRSEQVVREVLHESRAIFHRQLLLLRGDPAIVPELLEREQAARALAIGAQAPRTGAVLEAEGGSEGGEEEEEGEEEEDDDDGAFLLQGVRKASDEEARMVNERIAAGEGAEEAEEAEALTATALAAEGPSAMPVEEELLFDPAVQLLGQSNEAAARRAYVKLQKDQAEAERQLRELQEGDDAAAEEEDLFAGDSRARPKQRCGRCGALGHTRMSKRCPLYHLSDEDKPETIADANFMDTARGALNMNAIALQDVVKPAQAATTINLNLNAAREERAKRKADEQAHLQSRFTNSSRKRGRSSDSSPLEELNAMLKDAIIFVLRLKAAAPFKKAVNVRGAPDYAQYVTEPIDLNKMVARARSNQYTSAQALLDDLTLMHQNALNYNRDGRGDVSMIEDAQRCLTEGERWLNRHMDKLAAYEAALSSEAADAGE